MKLTILCSLEGRSGDWHEIGVFIWESIYLIGRSFGPLLSGLGDGLAIYFETRIE